MDAKPGQVTQLLNAMRMGDSRAADDLLPLVYAELHRLAKSYMRRERPEHTLQATALINEAYLRLVREDADWKNRAHFFGVAANMMRRVLVDYARAHNAERRAGGVKRVEMSDDLMISVEQLEEAALVDDALTRLAKLSPRQAQVAELRYFGGLSVEQISDLLKVAPRTVKQDWSLARIWLFRYLRPEEKPPEAAMRKS
jgi:RNA polymerase sigma-70 factor (ECF subfamily)